VLECVANVSEGTRTDVVAGLGAACGEDLLDVHTDPHHNRSVLTLVGVDAPRRLTTKAVDTLDLSRHAGVHPRLGVVDVVPFVPLAGSSMAAAVRARDDFATWAADTLALPCFLYGPERSLPDVRRTAWRSLQPDTGPRRPHPTAGTVCVGARNVLVAYNVWLAQPDLALAKNVAAAVRGPYLRALGLPVGQRVQVSMNLVDPMVLGPAQAVDLVAVHAEVAGAELVGLLPSAVLHAVPRERWAALDLGVDRTIEQRLSQR
jgi:glutamate formiminotransferase / 5-formyltetrahydrofolate cyclo-ligase